MSKSAAASPANLSYVLQRGAQVRRHRFFRRFSNVVLAAIIFAWLNAALYWLLANRANGFDFAASWAVLAVMFAIPPAVTAGMVALSQERLPLAGVAVGTLAAYAFGAAGLSALRIPLSFSSMAACLATSIIAMAYVAVRLWATWRESVLVLQFDRAKWLNERLGGRATIVSDVGSNPPDADIILIDVEAHHTPEWSRYLSRAYMRGVVVMPWSRYLERQQGRVDVQSFDVSDIAYSPGQVFYSQAKRGFDILAIVAFLPVWLPVLAVIALVVWSRAGSPIVFKQVRRGHGDRDFTMLKFRTMRVNSGCEPASLRDDRIFPPLAWLRHSRLDELPQIFNVLAGDMSLVGPRPEAAALAEKYESAIPQYLDRRLVLPGITGWAQVNGLSSRSADEAEVKLGYDLYYVKYLSFDLDVMILARTLRGLYRLMRRG